MKAKVIATTTVNNKPTKVGDVVDVDENTFRNLAKKGRLEAADAESKKVDLEGRSVLSEDQAEKQIETAEDARKAKKAADDAAKEAKK